MDAAESRAEKKRRKEEEDKRKNTGQSRGVKELKKVDTSGMKKMSDFFGKAAAKKKS
jgi:Ydr279p protein family (RNase H2 complex component).